MQQQGCCKVNGQVLPTFVKCGIWLGTAAFCRLLQIAAKRDNFAQKPGTFLGTATVTTPSNVPCCVVITNNNKRVFFLQKYRFHATLHGIQLYATEMCRSVAPGQLMRGAEPQHYGLEKQESRRWLWSKQESRRWLVRSFACTAHSLTCSNLLARSLIRSLAHFAHSRARGKVNYGCLKMTWFCPIVRGSLRRSVCSLVLRKNR